MTKNKDIFNDKFVESCHCTQSNLGYEAELENCVFLQSIDWNELNTNMCHTSGLFTFMNKVNEQFDQFAIIYEDFTGEEDLPYI